MSLYKPGTLPGGMKIRPASWPTLTHQPEPSPRKPSAAAPAPKPALQQAPQPTPQPTPPPDTDAILAKARLEAAELLQQAAEEAEQAMEAARKEGREMGLKEAAAEAQRLQEQAQQAVEQGRAQAQQIVQTAEAEARALRAEAEAERQAILAHAREEAANLVADARREQREMLEEAQQSLVDLAVTAAMRIVQGHLAVQPSSVVAMVRAGLKRLRDSDCTARVSLEDLPLLEAQRSTLERELGGGTLQLQADKGLAPGSFTLSSRQGEIDATFEQQSHRLRSALAKAVGGD